MYGRCRDLSILIRHCFVSRLLSSPSVWLAAEYKKVQEAEKAVSEYTSTYYIMYTSKDTDFLEGITLKSSVTLFGCLHGSVKH